MLVSTGPTPSAAPAALLMVAAGIIAAALWLALPRYSFEHINGGVMTVRGDMRTGKVCRIMPGVDPDSRFARDERLPPLCD